jgi:hypothetical protein
VSKDIRPGVMPDPSCPRLGLLKQGLAPGVRTRKRLIPAFGPVGRKTAPEPPCEGLRRNRFTKECQLSFLTQLPLSFFSYLFSTALQATLWARSSSPY